MVSSSDSTEISALRVKTRPPTESSAVLSLASAAVQMEPKRNTTESSGFGWLFIVALRSGDQQAEFRQKSKILLHGLSRHIAVRAMALRSEGRIEIADELIDGTRAVHQYQETAHGL